jgi:hypothetical protein
VKPLDRHNSKSLYNLAPAVFRAAFDKIPKQCFKMSESELARALEPEPELKRLRIAVWREYDIAFSEDRRMSLMRCLTGTITEERLLELLVVPEIFAWLAIRPAAFDLQAEEMLTLGMERMREILALPFVTRVPYVSAKGQIIRDDNGMPLMKDVVHTAIVAQVRMTIETLQNRVYGTVVQRSEIKQDVNQKSLNVNVTADPEPLSAVDKLSSLESQLKGLEERLQIGGISTADAPYEEYEDAEILPSGVPQRIVEEPDEF